MTVASKSTNTVISYYTNPITGCSVAMEERPRQDVSDGYSWWCRQCKTHKSIHAGSFFEKSRLTLQQWFLMIGLWAWDCPVIDAIPDCIIDIRTRIGIYEWLREVCTTKLLQAPIVLGGVVQMDESLFRHKPKVVI